MLASLFAPRSVTVSRRARAVTMVEYALLAAMAVVIIAVISAALSGGITQLMAKISNAFSNG
jgi:Flp pilus assembly pilin Flp